MQRAVTDGFVLDDDPDRVDRSAGACIRLHEFLGVRTGAGGDGRPDRGGRTGSRALGAGRPPAGIRPGRSDRRTVSYLADVYVLDEARDRGLGLELVRFTVDGGPLAATKWMLHTRDMHRLYARLGFVAPSERMMERARQADG